MSVISGVYKLSLARKGQSSVGPRPGCHHNQPTKKLPDSAVLSLRREYEAATTHAQCKEIVTRYATLYGAQFDSVKKIALYYTRSNPDRPLDPSLEHD